MKTVLPHPVCPHIVAERAVCGKRKISRWDEPAIFNIELRIHDDKKIDVQSAGRLCLLLDLDRYPSLAFSMPRSLPWRRSSSLVLRSSHKQYLLVKNSPRLTFARARSFTTVPTLGWRWLLGDAARYFFASSSRWWPSLSLFRGCKRPQCCERRVVARHYSRRALRCPSCCGRSRLGWCSRGC